MSQKSDPAGDRVWRVFYTRPRAEKRAAAELERAGLEVLLPLRVTIRQWSDRKKKVEEPLFPGYIFVRVDERERLQVLQHQQIVRTVTFAGEPARVSEVEIEHLRILLATPEALEAVTMDAFPRGTSVFIRQGPLAGVRGMVVEHPKSLYLIVEVPAIRHAVRVHVPADWVMRS